MREATTGTGGHFTTNACVSFLHGFRKVQDSNNPDLVLADKIFSQFIVLTLAVFLSHIAYDVFVDDQASFPLFAPFSFKEFFIPTVYALPLEAIAVLFSYVYYIRYYKTPSKTQLDIAREGRKK